MPPLRARVPAALSVVLALALAAPLTAYADEPTATSGPTASAGPTATVEPTPTATVEPSASAEPTATAEPTPTAEPVPAGAVTFPESTRVNPDREPYVVEVDAPAFDEVRVMAGWRTTTAPPVGPVTVALPDGQVTVAVRGCTSEGACTLLGSRDLEVRRELGLRLHYWSGQRVGPRAPVSMGFDTPREDRTGQAAWTLSDSSDVVVASGSVGYLPDPADARGVLLPLDVPTSVPDGEYRIDVDAVDDQEDFGELRTGSTTTITWDTRVRARLVADRDHFYPVRDKHLDATAIRLQAQELFSDGRIEVLAPGGEVVRTLRSGIASESTTVITRWDGLDDAGAMVPAGTYTVRAQLVDLAGNEGTVTTQVTVGHERLVEVSWKQTFRAADTVIDRTVGRCSTYRTPSTRRDRGSFQLASQTRCQRPAQSHAITLSGIYLPVSIGNDYRGVSVQMRGGPSRGARGAYVVFGFLEKGNRFDARTVLRGTYGKQKSVKPTNRKTVVRPDETGRRALYWQAGLSEGSRWDVESYTVRARIQVLR